MIIALSGGQKSKDVINEIELQFRNNGDSIIPIEYIDDIDRQYKLGNAFERVLITEQSILKDYSVTDINEIRGSIQRCIDASIKRNRYEEYVFLTKSKELADIILEETFLVSQNVAIIYKDMESYTTQFIAALLAHDLEEIKKFAYTIKDEPVKQVNNNRTTEKVEEIKSDSDIDDFNDFETDEIGNNSSAFDFEPSNENEFETEEFDSFNDSFNDSDNDSFLDDFDLDAVENEVDTEMEQEKQSNNSLNKEDDFEENKSNGDDFEENKSNDDDFEPLDENENQPVVESEFIDADFEPLDENENQPVVESEFIDADSEFESFTFDDEPITFEEEQDEFEKPSELVQDTDSNKVENNNDFDNSQMNSGTDDFEDMFDDSLFEELNSTSKEKESLDTTENSQVNDNFEENQEIIEFTEDDFEGTETFEVTDEEKDFQNDKNIEESNEVEQPFENSTIYDDTLYENESKIDATEEQNLGFEENDNFEENNSSSDFEENDFEENNSEPSQVTEVQVNNQVNTQVEIENKNNAKIDVDKAKEDLNNLTNELYEEKKEEEITADELYEDSSTSGPKVNVSSEIIKAKLDAYAERGHSIVFTGCGGSGTSTVAFNVANTLVNMGYRVLLVDFNTENKTLSYISKNNYDSFSQENDNVVRAINSMKSLDDCVAIPRPNFHLIASGLATDKNELSKYMTENKMTRFMSNSKTSYNFIVYDINMKDLTNCAKELLLNCDTIETVVDSSTTGFSKYMIDVCNIEDEDVLEAILYKSKVIINRHTNLQKLLGLKIKKPSDTLRAIDNILRKLPGAPDGIMFSRIPINYILKFDPRYEEFCFTNKAYSDTKEGAELYKDLISKIVTNFKCK